MVIQTKNDQQSVSIIKISLLLISFFLVFTSYASFPDEAYQKKEWIVVIDPGHGGKDPGALGSVSQEKNITLSVALKAGELIEKEISNVKVIYTRKTDVFVELSKRADIANKNKADLFISIHANSHQNRNTYGVETYVMGHHKDQQNLEVAMKENEVILLEKDYSTKYEGFDPRSPESYIIFTLMQSAFFEQSTNLASSIQNQFKEQVQRFDRGVKQAGFWVLYMTTMPSILIEIGFISNPAEEKYLNSKQGQEQIAKAIFNACREYILEAEKKSGISAIRMDNTDNKNNYGDQSVQAEAVQAHIIFMVQVLSSSRKVEIAPGNFKNLTDITEIHSDNRYRYATGKFYTYEQAVQHRKKIEALYPDAFVIAVKENKVLPLQEALSEIRKK